MKVLILTLILSLFSFNSYSKEEIKFDFENYQSEREKIIKMQNDNETDKKILDKTEIGIAYYDLNDDGKNEIITKICNHILFGSNECIINIYQIDRNNKYIYIGINANFDLFVSNNKTNSFYDLYSSIKIPCDIEKCITRDGILHNTVLKLFKYQDKGYEIILP